MTRIEKIRDGIRAVLTQAFSSAGVAVDIWDLSDAKNADRIPDRFPAVMLAYAGHGTPEDSELSSRTNLPTIYRWVIVIAAENWRSPVAALNDTLGCEELEEMLFDSLRTTPLAQIGDEEVYLVHVDTAPEDFSGVQAGIRALRQQWQTNQILV